MPRKSTKENKNRYQLDREREGLTREKASEKSGLSEDQIAKIENSSNGRIPTPDEILLLTKAYKSDDLPYYYCNHECAIGNNYMPTYKSRDISEISVGMQVNVTRLTNHMNELFEIAEDNMITEDEHSDIKEILGFLDQLESVSQSLRVLINKLENDGR